MDQKEFRSRITDLFLGSIVDLIILADQANPHKNPAELKKKVDSTVSNMLVGYITEYIDSVVTQLGETGDMTILKDLEGAKDEDDRVLH